MRIFRSLAFHLSAPMPWDSPITTASSLSSERPSSRRVPWSLLGDPDLDSLELVPRSDGYTHHS